MTTKLTNSTPARLTARWAVFAVCVPVAFWQTGRRIDSEAANGSMVAYIYGMVVLAIIAAFGIARRRSGELPIHDRQTDNIVGGMGVGMALAILWLLVPRYADQYQLLHLDSLAGQIFMFSAAVLLFGLRPVTRFWPVWLFMIVFTPLPYRLLVVGMGGRESDECVAMILMTACATAIAVGRTRGRAAAGAVSALAVGGATLVVLRHLLPDAHAPALRYLPSVVAVAVVTTTFFFVRRTGRPKRFFARAMEPLTAQQVRHSALFLVAASAVSFLLPLPPPTAQPIGTAPAVVRLGAPLAIPAGWVQTDLREFDFVQRFLGPESTMLRQRLVAQQGNFTSDVLGRPRIVVVDTLDTVDPEGLSVYAEGSLYPTSGARRSPSLEVYLGYGVTARLYTVVDEGLLLTWTKLTFMWSNEELTQRVTVISVDNHEPDAAFPEPQVARGGYLNNLMSTLLRGNSVALDTESTYKDLDMLRAVGRALVHTQYGSAP